MVLHSEFQTPRLERTFGTAPISKLGTAYIANDLLLNDQFDMPVISTKISRHGPFILVNIMSGLDWKKWNQ